MWNYASPARRFDYGLILPINNTLLSCYLTSILLDRLHHVLLAHMQTFQLGNVW